MNLDLHLIRTDGGTQSRAQMDWIAIDEYAKAMAAGDTFPPVVVFYDGEAYWLADGFHRVRAALQVGLAEVVADVRQGTVRDAILCSVGSNSEHGVRRTTRDKRKAVLMLLNDEEWRKWNDSEIGRRCGGVHHTTVATIRSAILLNSQDKPAKPKKRKVKRKGKTYEMDTTNIGQAKSDEAEVEAQPDLFSGESIPDFVPTEWSEPEVLPIIVHNKNAALLADYCQGVDLVITSPPYNVDLDYDQHDDTLMNYLEFLADIWEECWKVMVDGARLCVVVPFGVGRKPYVSLASHIAGLLIEAGYTLRGQIVWDKGTTGNRTTWGSFRSATNPALRDRTECILVAHKGDSALEIPPEHLRKDEKGVYTPWLQDGDYFMELAQDVWKVAPESAQRVKHPAPFPTELVKRLVHFYGYPGCHLLDPFAGSGTVGVVAKELGCQATLFEVSEGYCQLAEERIHASLR